MRLAVLVGTALALGYIYGGYLALLVAAAAVRRRVRGPRSEPPAEGEGAAAAPFLPPLTVYFSALDEEDQVEARIEDILAQDYPADRVQVLVISDGSTDRTAERARATAARHPARDIRVEAFEENRGQAAAQNLAARVAAHDILVSTDAETRFRPGFLRRLVAPLADPGVGVTGGRILYRSARSVIADSIKDYRRVEWAIRRAETDLGIMAKTDGPGMAYRRSLWRPIEPFEDADQVVILFARQRGMEAVHVDEAVCVDSPNVTWRQELRSRARMTRKALLSIFHRWGWRDCLGQPGFTFGLFSHKVVRFFSPVFLVALLGAGLSLAWGRPRLLAALAAGGAAAALGVAVLEVASPGRGKRVLKRLGAFLLANLGFAWGLVTWVAGDRSGRYRPTRRLG